MKLFFNLRKKGVNFMRRKTFIGFCSFIVLAALLSTQAMAKGGRIHFGKLKVLPSMEVQVVYDDNIYLGNGNGEKNEATKVDLISHIKPGIALEYEIARRGNIRLGYKGDFALYRDYSDNDWESHRIFFDVDYKAPAGLFFEFGETYINSDDPHGSADQYQIGEITQRWTNNLTGNVGYKFHDRFKATVFSKYYKQDYDLDTDFAQDYTVAELGMGVGFKVLPKTWGFFRIFYGEQDYYTDRGEVDSDNNATNNWQRINFGLKWDDDAKLGGELNFGYKWMYYDNDFDINGDSYDDRNTWIASTLINYKAAAGTNLIFNISRAIRTSGADTHEYYDDTAVGFNVEQKLIAKFVLTLGALYSNNDYNTNDRRDNNYSADIDFKYQIQDWMSAAVGYKYDRKDSTASENDYTDNKVLFTLGVAY